MKKKILAALLLSVISASLIAGCSTNNSAPAGEGDEQTQQAEQTEKAATEKPAKKTNKGKYDNIDADSVPIGVDEVEFVNDDGYVDIVGRIYKNGGDIEKSYVSVTFEICDETGARIGEKIVAPDNALKAGEDTRFDENLIWELDEKYYHNVPDETVAGYTAKIIDVKETDADEAELEATISDIESAIKWNKEYDKAQILLDAAMQKYPDNTDLKLLQSELDTEKAKDAEGQK